MFREAGNASLVDLEKDIQERKALVGFFKTKIAELSLEDKISQMKNDNCSKKVLAQHETGLKALRAMSSSFAKVASNFIK